MKKLSYLLIVILFAACKKDPTPQKSSVFLQYSVKTSTNSLTGSSYYVKVTYTDASGSTQTQTFTSTEAKDIQLNMDNYPYGTQASLKVESNFPNYGVSLTAKIITAENSPVVLAEKTSTENSFTISSMVNAH